MNKLASECRSQKYQKALMKHKQKDSFALAFYPMQNQGIIFSLPKESIDTHTGCNRGLETGPLLGALQDNYIIWKGQQFTRIH